jgi:hypothetical protein
MPGSEITLTIWTDTAASETLAASLADEAAKSVFRATGHNSAAVASSVRAVEPAEVVEAAKAFSEKSRTA